eukprot:m51a1_g11339 putative protein serine threonine kinase (630) ;mRNA; f:152855-155557
MDHYMDRLGKIANKVASKAHTGVSALASKLKETPVFVDPKTGRRYKVKKLLSSAGRFGEVYLAEEELASGAGGQQYALKRMPLNSSNRSEIRHEIELMERLNGHRNVCRLESSIQAEGEVVLVLEFCPGGSLLDLMNRTRERQANLPSHKQGIPEREVLALFLQVCEAVAHLHSQTPPVIHRDLKIENVLLAADGRTCKLCDFGSATTEVMLANSEGERQRVEADLAHNTTPTYRAPEMVDLFRRQAITEKSDVWALGCVLYKLAFERDAFEEGSLAILNMRYTFPKFHNFSDAFIETIKYCWEPDPERRPDVGALCRRVAQMLGTTTAAANFVAGARPQASAGSSLSSSEPRVPAGRGGAAPAAAGAGGKDLFSMLAWESNSAAPQRQDEDPADAHVQTIQFGNPDEDSGPQQGQHDDFFSSFNQAPAPKPATPPPAQPVRGQSPAAAPARPQAAATDFFGAFEEAPSPMQTSPPPTSSPSFSSPQQRMSPQPVQQNRTSPPPHTQSPARVDDLFGWSSSSPAAAQPQQQRQPDLLSDNPSAGSSPMADILSLGSPASPAISAKKSSTPSLGQSKSPAPAPKSAAEIEASMLSWDNIKDSFSMNPKTAQQQQQQQKAGTPTLAQMKRL